MTILLNTTVRFVFAMLCAAVFIVSCGRSPQAAETESITESAKKETIRRASLVFGGDVMVHMPQIAAAKRDSTYDFSESFRYVKPIFDSADIVVVNLETTVSETGQYFGYPLFSSPPELVGALRESGVDILALANNHICDKGAEGIRATVAAVEKAGLKYTGAFADSAAQRESHPLKFEAGGIRFALLNYTYGTNGMPVPKGMTVNLIDTVRIISDIASARSDSAEVVIIYFHWGLEYMRTPTRHDKALAQWCHEQGADVIIGSHPHVIQRPETLADTAGIVRQITVYSLGNLVSNQRKRYTDGGMIFQLDISLGDSLPPAFEASYILTWTYIHRQGGRNYYHILPKPVGDTLLRVNTSARTSYDLFISDTRQLLDSLPGFRE